MVLVAYADNWIVGGDDVAGTGLPHIESDGGAEYEWDPYSK